MASRRSRLNSTATNAALPERRPLAISSLERISKGRRRRAHGGADRGREPAKPRDRPADFFENSLERATALVFPHEAVGAVLSLPREGGHVGVYSQSARRRALQKESLKSRVSEASRERERERASLEKRVAKEGAAAARLHLSSGWPSHFCLWYSRTRTAHSSSRTSRSGRTARSLRARRPLKTAYDATLDKSAPPQSARRPFALSLSLSLS